MRRIQRYHVLSVFGDMKPHRYTDAVMIGSLHIANPVNRMEIWPGQKIARNAYYSNIFEGFLNECFNSGLLMLVDNDGTKKTRLTRCGHSSHPAPEGPCFAYQISPRDFDIQLTKKGRECLCTEQIARDGDYSFYKKFDGSIDSAKTINPGLFEGRNN